MSAPPEDSDESEAEKPEPYAVVLSPGAPRALREQLPSAAAFAAWEFIKGPLREEPYRVGAPLQAPFERYWRARRGEYRVRYRIDEEKREIVVMDVDHRRDAYHA